MPIGTGRTVCTALQKNRVSTSTLMEPAIKFSEHVILIDADFLQNTISHIRRILSERMERTLPPIDLPTWLTYLLLDADVRGEHNDIQILVTDNARQQTHWEACTPHSAHDIDGKACHTALGECSFSVITSEGLTTPTSLYQDLMGLVLNDATVKKLLLVTTMNEDELNDTLRQWQQELETCKAQLYYGSIVSPAHQQYYTWLPLTYSLSHAWNLRENELK